MSVCNVYKSLHLFDTARSPIESSSVPSAAEARPQHPRLFLFLTLAPFPWRECRSKSRAPTGRQIEKGANHFFISATSDRPKPSWCRHESASCKSLSCLYRTMNRLCEIYAFWRWAQNYAHFRECDELWKRKRRSGSVL